MKKLSIFIMLCASLFGTYAEACFEGIFDAPEEIDRIGLASKFLPYNPAIIAIMPSANCARHIARWRPKSSLTASHTFSARKNQVCDFLWIGNDTSNLTVYNAITALAQQCKVIYTPTHFSKSRFQFARLRQYLERNNFCLLSHWFEDGKKGNAIFVRKDLFDAAIRSLNYKPERSLASTPHAYTIEQFLKRAENKTQDAHFDPIDYIYMINLDERPEKFLQAADGLQPYGIKPYRFSAVNGWKLPCKILHELGVRVFSDMLGDAFIGTRYVEVDGKDYMSNEIIDPNRGPYFALEMTRGAVGIVLSHLSVLQDAYKSGYRTIWVMEDDVEVVGEPRNIASLIRKLDAIDPDWDVLFTDIDTKDSQGRHVPCRALAARPNFSIEPIDVYLNRCYRVDNDFSRVGMRYGAYSMIIRRSGMRKIMDHYNSYGIFIPYDTDFWLIPDLNMYGVNTDIVSHRAGALSDNGLPRYTKKSYAR